MRLFLAAHPGYVLSDVHRQISYAGQNIHKALLFSETINKCDVDHNSIDLLRNGITKPHLGIYLRLPATESSWIQPKSFLHKSNIFPLVLFLTRDRLLK